MLGLIGAGLGLTGALLARPKQYDVSSIMRDYRKQFEPAMQTYNTIGDYGSGLLNMDSDFNTRLQNQFSSMAADRLAQNNRANTANNARFGGLSGLLNAQNNASGVGFTQAGIDAFNNAYRSNMGMGMNALNTQAGGLLNIGQNIGDTMGNLTTANTDMRNNYFTGLGNNLMTMGMNPSILQNFR